MMSAGVVTCLEHTLHGLEDGDSVLFKEVQGMVELNNGQQHKVTSKTPSEFYIGDTTRFADYVSGGLVKKVKTKSTMHFVCITPTIFFFSYCLFSFFPL